jgi:hypothetical protein
VVRLLSQSFIGGKVTTEAFAVNKTRQSRKEYIMIEQQLLLTAVGPQLHSFVQDQDFNSSWTSLDKQAFSSQFNNLTAKMPAYNAFHTRERRLWSLKLATGSVPADLETAFQQSVPAGIQAYRDAFGSAANCLQIIEKSGFGNVLERHSGDFTRYLADEQHPFGAIVIHHFRHMGCSTPMIQEFQNNFRSTNFDFINLVGKGHFSNLGPALQQGMDAQVEILQYTQKNGLTYLRGHCGPPAWAVAVSEVLAWFGISISAWAVVAVIATLVATIILICTLHILPSNIQSLCDEIKLDLSLNF